MKLPAGMVSCPRAVWLSTKCGGLRLGLFTLLSFMVASAVEEYEAMNTVSEEGMIQRDQRQLS